MKKLILLHLLILCLLSFNTGCATTQGTQISATQIVSTSLVAVGDLIKQTRPVADALFKAGTITVDQYNQVAVYYLQARAAYIVAVDAAEAAVKAGQALDTSAAFQTAFAQLNKQSGDLQALINSFKGGK
jgi:hypothetical protein